ncbi:helix-turn-helix domain-containing protein [Pseudomonas putida]|uniref:helix-turn-helix domain-containing protein n=1 Tax=Pseudomonas putida TaxID=303 RepID=UPI000646C53B|nr:helix-turn-helix transcriptional regulator [Pseudomonas putida]NTY90337.1 helix-turn-helix transcriptional regulator [Pseudomonas putida]NTY98879.1 helix-turn-helix transcriptional regulator [Pseudomonas putida]NTZ21162.1 helix-turn-helix transcriptional regulator [Pseudomonas putida]NTZ53319.1 helix-turn-helix transcriptional regulator [Pseudomonas putida]NTZ65031.1 helix-turn-helix transcriptional regulator [Pseudomonas putida]
MPDDLTDLNVELGNVLRDIRLGKNLRQADIYDHVTGRAYWGELERGIKSPTVKKLDEISEFLGLHPLTALAICYSRQRGITPKQLLKELDKAIAKTKLGADE